MLADRWGNRLLNGVRISDSLGGGSALFNDLDLKTTRLSWTDEGQGLGLERRAFDM